jgi:hypothetical protein
MQLVAAAAPRKPSGSSSALYVSAVYILFQSASGASKASRFTINRACHRDDIDVATAFKAQ